MSLNAMVWALEDSPVADTTERLILIGMAEKADSDGCNAFRSRKTLARLSLCDVKTVQRKLNAMASRGVIALGDQSAARRIPQHVRPKVYDLLIPCSWFGAERLKTVNLERQERGLPPLTPQNRPEIAPAPPKNRRSDLGKKRAKHDDGASAAQAEGGTLNPPGGDSQSPGRGGLSVPGGGTHSPDGGDSQSREGGLSDPQHSPVTQPPTRPSIRPCAGGPEAGTDGRTDGGGVIEDQEEHGPLPLGWGSGQTAAAAGDAGGLGGDADRRRQTTPGLEILRRVGQRAPELALAGRPLEDQARRLNGIMAESEHRGDPWTVAQLVDVLSAPLGGPVRHSAGGVISARIRALPPTPHTAPQLLPHQAPGVQAPSDVSMERGPAVRRSCEICERPFPARAAIPQDGLCASCRSELERAAVAHAAV